MSNLIAGTGVSHIWGDLQQFLEQQKINLVTEKFIFRKMNFRNKN